MSVGRLIGTDVHTKGPNGDHVRDQTVQLHNTLFSTSSKKGVRIQVVVLDEVSICSSGPPPQR